MANSEDLLQTLGDFTSKENWDKFFTIRGSDDSFEWYAEWPQLSRPLLTHLSNLPSLAHASTSQLLVPGCGNSRLSEHLYDAGFLGITNIDFSKVVIGDMLRRNVRQRPHMRWRVMDMTGMQFADGTFDAVVDKGGLDALMEPELGPKLGNQYLSEVKRVLKPGGKYVCLTLAESHVLDILFSKFRIGWKMTVDVIPLESSTKPNLQTFLVVVEKEMSALVHQITSLLDNSSLHCNSKQACGLREALQNENEIRKQYSSSSDILYSLEELQLGAGGELTKLSQGRRLQLTLGGQGISQFSYRSVLLDAEETSGPFTYHCGVFIVPNTRAREWLFFSEEGQWMVVRSSKAARLIMVFLDPSHTNASMDEIQKDLSPLVKQLEPAKNQNDAQIPHGAGKEFENSLCLQFTHRSNHFVGPLFWEISDLDTMLIYDFLMASDGIKKRNIVHRVTSSLTGPIIVEDVVYENVDNDVSRVLPSSDLVFRRLVFERAANLVQSEAILKEEQSPSKLIGETEKKKTTSSSKSRKRGYQRKVGDATNWSVVYHGYLASSYHTGIVSGLMLISSYLESMASSGRVVKAVIVGLGAGLLPMFLHRCIPFMHIEAVELDPVIVDIARGYFNFAEDDRLKVHVADGIQFVTNREVSVPTTTEVSAAPCHSNRHCITSNVEVDIIVIDVDSSDPSFGMTCPAPDFLDESFLKSAKAKLSEQGLFVVNLVSRSQAIKDHVLVRMKEVFNHLFCLQLDEDVNEVHFALNTESCIEDSHFSDAALKLEQLLKFENPEMRKNVIDATEKIRRLK